jgi:hypothetical protein
MYPAEVLGNCPCLVALNGPDKVPFDLQVGQFHHLFQGFLQVVFTKTTHTGTPGSAYFVNVLSLPFRATRQGQLPSTSAGYIR